jgi:dienelactone hydrolase
MHLGQTILWLLAGMALGTAGARADGAGTRDLPTRVELRPLETLTLSDRQFLAGDATGAARTLLGGELSVAQGSGRLPVVILMHGSSGVGGNIPYWQRHLHAAGISTFVIDGMSGRGLTTVGENQGALGRLNFTLDIYRALALLAKHPRVDPQRIGLMGFSRGGQGALYASLERFHKLWNPGGAEIAAYVAFYPDCGTTYREDDKVVKKPIRIFHGTPDDYNPVRTCKAYVERLKRAGADVELTEYPNAEHGFDNPIGPNPAVVAKTSQSVRDCDIREGDEGVLTNAATGAAFGYKDECVRLGPKVGYNPAATEASTKAVLEFFGATLKR